MVPTPGQVTPIRLLPLPDQQATGTGEAIDPGTKDAGDFLTWLDEIRLAAAANREVNVPCGSCNACCRSGYFIRVHKSETDALANIPQPLLFPAPGEPDVLVMGFDEQGRCPMLVDDACSIYADRPQTCRTYDCRLFAACGIQPEQSRPDVVAAAAQWRFSSGGDNQDQTGKLAQRALVTAAAFLSEHQPQLPMLSDNPLQLALAALKCQPLFCAYPLPGQQDMLEAIKKTLAIPED